jgi:hypothetical protein
MKLRFLLALFFLLAGSPALAEKLTFDHRLYPPLKQVLDSGRGEMVYSDQSNPRYLFNRIAIQGRSASDWDEAIEIVARSSTRGMNRPEDWLRELRSRIPAGCSSQFTTIAQDEVSITFERRSRGCGPDISQTGLYRIVNGKHSLFLLAALYRGEMTEAMRGQWLALMASAHLQ